MNSEDEERFVAFVRERGEHHLRVAVLLTGSPTEAEDLLQASLIRLYRAWPRLEVSASSPDAYLRKIIVNTRRSWWRSRWRQESPTIRAVKNGPVTISATVAVDKKGLVRRLVITTTLLPVPGEPWKQLTDDVTFGAFGVPVPVAAPPASQVINLGHHPYLGYFPI